MPCIAHTRLPPDPGFVVIPHAGHTDAQELMSSEIAIPEVDPIVAGLSTR